MKQQNIHWKKKNLKFFGFFFSKSQNGGKFTKLAGFTNYEITKCGDPLYHSTNSSPRIFIFLSHDWPRFFLIKKTKIRNKKNVLDSIATTENERIFQQFHFFLRESKYEAYFDIRYFKCRSKPILLKYFCFYIS